MSLSQSIFFFRLHFWIIGMLLSALLYSAPALAMPTKDSTQASAQGDTLSEAQQAITKGMATKAKREKDAKKIVVQQTQGMQHARFVENVGQLPDSILYTLGLPGGGTAYFLKNSYYITQMNAADYLDAHIAVSHGTKNALDSIKNHVTRGHTYGVVFDKVSAELRITPKKLLPFKQNYILGYLKKQKKGGENMQARVAESIVYENIYKGIDVRFFMQNGELKHNIIVHAGAKLSDYQMRYIGLNSLKVQAKKLTLQTSVSTMTEKIPESYQLDSAGEKVLINVKFRQDKKTGKVYFHAGNADTTQTLIIDPVLIFATFSGSTTDNWGFTATYGRDGSMYLAGITFGIGTFTGSIGAFQRNFKPGARNVYGTPQATDILIAKFSPDGRNLLYMTFLGGSGDDIPHSLIEDNNGQVIILGRTNSVDFPTGNLTRRGPSGGNFDIDILLTKLNHDGSQVQKSWIIGGSGLDGANMSGEYVNGGRGEDRLYNFYGDDARGEVNVDDNGFVYVASQTQSSDFPTTIAGVDGATHTAHQGRNGGRQDAVIMKFDVLMENILYASYLGGAGDDAAFVVSISPQNANIYVAGSTQSSNFPGVRTTSVKSTNNGIDGFVTEINGRDYSVARSTYVGTNAKDGVYGLRIDRQGFVYVVGITTGDWPVINAPYQDAGGKQFIGKLQPDLNAWVYTTRFGTNSRAPNISPIAFAIDRCAHVYVSGFGQAGNNHLNIGTRGMRVTPDAIRRVTDNQDFYFAVFDTDAKGLLYATFFGNLNGAFDHVDGGTSRYDPTGVIYQGICAGPGVYPSSPGSFSPTSGRRSSYNMYGVKIDFQLAGVTANLLTSIYGIPNRTIGCAAATFDMEDLALNAKSYDWFFNFTPGVGSLRPDMTTTEPKVQHTYPAVGDYTVKMVAKDPATCNQTDTSTRILSVRSNRINADFSIGLKKDCNTLLYTFFNTSHADPTNTEATDINNVLFQWNFGDGTTQVSRGLSSVDHIFPAIGPYQVTISVLSEFICNHSIPNTRTVRISNDIQTNFIIPEGDLCVGMPATFINSSTGGEAFTWNIDGTDVVRSENLTYTFSTGGEHTVNLHGFDKNTCNLEDDTTITVFVAPPSIPRFSYGYENPDKKEFPRFFNESENANHYIWDFGDGTILRTDKIDTTIYHLYEQTGTYNVCLSAYMDPNCIQKVCEPIAVTVNPYIKAPTAFTPNGDGINDVFLPIVRNAQQYEINIYNRWGQLVFLSKDPKEGWDGRMNRQGQIQATDMYFYTIDIRTFQGERMQSKGVIYLLR